MLGFFPLIIKGIKYMYATKHQSYSIRNKFWPIPFNSHQGKITSNPLQHYHYRFCYRLWYAVALFLLENSLHYTFVAEHLECDYDNYMHVHFFWGGGGVKVCEKKSSSKKSVFFFERVGVGVDTWRTFRHKQILNRHLLSSEIFKCGVLRY